MTLRRFDLAVAAEAEQALTRISAGKEVSSEVLTRLKGLPVLLRTSGVSATLAFFAARSGSDNLGRAYREVRGALVAQLCGVLQWESPLPDRELYQRLAMLPTSELARSAVRLEAFAGWLRRLAEGMEREQERVKRGESTSGANDAGGNGEVSDG